MKNNIKIMTIMLTLLVVFEISSAKANTQDVRTNINTTIGTNVVKNAGSYINTREYPSLYTESVSCSTQFAIADADNNYTRYYDTTPGNTFTVTNPSSIKGPNSVITLFLRNDPDKFCFLNDYSGILFH